MKIRTILRKGSDHKIFCQDFLSFYEDNSWFVGGVFDGCSDSYSQHEIPQSQFPSNLFAKILTSSCKSILIQTQELNFLKFNIEYIFLNLLEDFFKHVYTISTSLGLIEDEMESTVIIFLYHKQTKAGYIIALGDGVIQIDDIFEYIDQNNKPLYPILYIEKILDDIDETMNIWTIDNSIDIMDKFNIRPYKLYKIQDPKNVVISTDGILSFENKNDAGLSPDLIKDIFLKDSSMSNLEKMLPRKYNIVQTQGWVNCDDLGMIRIIFDD